MTIKILAFTGSMRADSINKRLLKIGIDRLREKGVEVTELELRNLDIPLFDQDYEDRIKAGKEDLPKGIHTLRQAMIDADAFLIASPEHNGTMSAALKNAIDWASRAIEGDKPLVCFMGKTAGIMAASGGKLGGVRGLPELRRVLSGIGTTVVTPDFAAGGVPMDTSADGWNDDATVKGAHRVADALAELGQKRHG